MSDYPDFKESTEEKLERLGACGMGYPDLGLPCIRPVGHDGPLSDCFALVKNSFGETVGCYMQQDGKDWITDQSQFPTDLVISTPLVSLATRPNVCSTSEKMEEIVPDRRGLVAHSRGKS